MTLLSECYLVLLGVLTLWPNLKSSYQVLLTPPHTKLKQAFVIHKPFYIAFTQRIVNCCACAVCSWSSWCSAQFKLLLVQCGTGGVLIGV